MQSLIGLIGEAYRVNGGRIVMPSSLPNALLFGAHGDGYEIVAHAERPASKDQLRLMLLGLLGRSFQAGDTPRDEDDSGIPVGGGERWAETRRV